MNELFVKAGLLVDGTSSQTIKDAIILVEDDRITRIGREGEFGQPASSTLIDAKDAVVMPGMFDLHTHLGTPKVDDMVKFMLTTPQSLVQYYAIENCLATLGAGFTSVRSMSWYPEFNDVSLRRAVDMGMVVGPRISASRRVITQTGGHGDLIIPFHDLGRIQFGRVADGAQEVRKAAREQLREGADFLKTFSSGGQASGTGRLALNYSVDELKVVADEAHAAGKTSAVHASNLVGVKNAVDAGIDTIEHGDIFDDEIIEAMLKKGTFYTPTLSILDAQSRITSPTLFKLPKADQNRLELILASVRKAHEAGVKIVTGTDTLGAPLKHGENAKELIMLTRAGFTNLEAIQAATKVSAMAVKKGADLGTLEVGKLADMLVVAGNPVQDISVLTDPSRIRTVVKGGRVAIQK